MRQAHDLRRGFMAVGGIQSGPQTSSDDGMVPPLLSGICVKAAKHPALAADASIRGLLGAPTEAAVGWSGELLLWEVAPAQLVLLPRS